MKQGRKKDVLRRFIPSGLYWIARRDLTISFRSVEELEGRPAGSPVLAQRAASESPRWTARSGRPVKPPLCEERVSGRTMRHGRLTVSPACANMTLLIRRVAHLTERAASEGPHWTRTVGDQSGHPCRIEEALWNNLWKVRSTRELQGRQVTLSQRKSKPTGEHLCSECHRRSH